MSTPFQTTRRVEFGDTDMAGIVHFANFFRYMEAAETDFLRARGLSVAWQHGGQRYGFPRVSAACDWVRPVRFADVLTIAVTVEKVGRKSVSYRHDFALEGEPVATGRVTAVFCLKGPNGELESADIPPDVRAALES
ncbi:MAG TPA: thioesterase family protein [Gemmataceae bacterium]|jgi:YbgC/YbaW family acyl-CoA thioester hydrolase|nr:thioesterase family protein [Gemmataceae bacterium]